MKRMHIHVGVESLEQSIAFYNALFGTEPVKTKTDYAKWLLDDPRVNFAISTRSGKVGADHLGLQVDDESELAELRARLKRAEMPVFNEGETECCYARSDKSWLKDPSGLPWEVYQTMTNAPLFSTPTTTKESACSTPTIKNQSGCCELLEKISRCCG